jgi:hypothetical protein
MGASHEAAYLWGVAWWIARLDNGTWLVGVAKGGKKITGAGEDVFAAVRDAQGKLEEEFKKTGLENKESI